MSSKPEAPGTLADIVHHDDVEGPAAVCFSTKFSVFRYSLCLSVCLLLGGAGVPGSGYVGALILFGSLILGWRCRRQFRAEFLMKMDDSGMLNPGGRAGEEQ